MKILRIIARLNVGGPARHVVWLAKEFADDEFQTVLAAGTVPDGEEDMSYLALESGIEPIYIEQMSRELSPKDAVSLWKIFGLMRAERPDIVHTHTAKAGTVGRAAAFLYRWLTWKTFIGKPRKIKIVHTFHGHIFHSYYGKLKTSLFIFIEKALAKFATDKIVVISDQQFREIHEEVGIGKRLQFSVVPLGIDLEQFKDTEPHRPHFRKEIGADETDVLVSLVGRLTEIKNISMFLNAAALAKKMAADEGIAFKFAIVGDGHMRRQLEKESIELGLEKDLTFAGNRKDTENIYAASDIIGLTSFNEGTPLSLIEAMASGRPVISTAVGGVVDLLGDPIEKHKDIEVCENGLGIAAGYAEDFAEGLIYLAKNERLRGELGKNSKNFVTKRYSKERLVNDLKKLYRSL